MYSYWAKTGSERSYHPLPYHSIDVSVVAEEWLNNNKKEVLKHINKTHITYNTIKELFLFFASLHDLGKFSTTFQGLCSDIFKKLQDRESINEYNIRHDQLGYMIWKEIIEQYVMDKINPKNENLFYLIEVFAKVVFGHHGKPPLDECKDISNYFNKKDIECVKSLIDSSFSIFISDESINELSKWSEKKRIERKESLSYLKILSWHFAGAIVLSDWIASGYFPFENKEIKLDTYRNNVFSIAKKSFEDAGLISAPSNSKKGFEHLFPIYAKTPTPLQKKCNEIKLTNGPQLWILEDVAGAGKTEAAYTLASRMIHSGIAKGIFIALPTMATSNAMYERMADVYHKFFDEKSIPSLVLSHSSRHLSETFKNSYKDIKEVKIDSDDNSPNCSKWLSDSSKKALLADAGVGTLDQVLISALPFRYQSLRILGMANKVLIVDEIHSYSHYMLEILETVITHHAMIGSPVILLSATLPNLIKKRLYAAFYKGLNLNTPEIINNNQFPLISSVNKNEINEYEIKTKKQLERSIDIKFTNNEKALKIIKEAYDKNKCVCWIRNTIKDVNETYTSLAHLTGIAQENIEIFHSRFALADRIKIENKVLARFGKKSTSKDRSKRILIASQVVEQSLDLDFDIIITDLAPIDLIIQRAGRQHRHLRDKKGNIIDSKKESDRESPIFYINIPPEEKEIKKSWFKDYFSTAHYVYTDTALLWRTKEILKSEGKITMPERARYLIESVYGETPIYAPDVFLDAEENSNATKIAERNIAKFNKLHFSFGYSQDSGNKWYEDDEENTSKGISTRLGEEQIKIVLANFEKGKLTPYYNDKNGFGWDLSAIKISFRKLAKVNENIALKEIERLKNDKKIYKKTIVLVVNKKLEWIGENQEGKTVNIKYNDKIGLTVEKLGE